MNVPNQISLARMLMMPVLIFFYLADFIPYGKLVALIIYFLAWMSDIVDGYIARKYNMVTSLGKLLDPVADKLLVTTVVIIFIADGIIPHPYGIIFAFIMFLRDYVVTGIRQIAATKNKVLAANWTNKVKSWPLYAGCFGGLLIAFLNDLALSAQTMNVLNIIFYVIIGIGAVMLLVSMVVYIIQNHSVLREEKK